MGSTLLLQMTQTEATAWSGTTREEDDGGSHPPQYHGTRRKRTPGARGQAT